MYSFRVGPVVTTEKFLPLNYPQIKKFLDYSLPKISQQGLVAHIIGKAIVDINSTKDFDVWLTGTIRDINKFSTVFYDCYNYAFNHLSLRLDMSWISNVKHVFLVDGQLIRPPDIYFIAATLTRATNDQGLVSFEENVVDQYGYSKLTDYLAIKNFNKNNPKFSKAHCYDLLNQFGYLSPSIEGYEYLEFVNSKLG